ncbi:MAG: sugar ABC transporter permease [Gaiellaceae bacterium]|jgi:raffinose/stachyose/melibiose transport system permease protein|nr:MAG: sugar ABC transporter permease [Gaiellaceae bacterium]
MSVPAGSTNARPAARRRRRRSGLPQVPWVWVLPALVLVLLLRYVATAAGGWYAFTDWNGISREAQFIGLDNFREILDNPASRGALENTIVLAVTFVVAANVIGLLLALALHRTLKTRILLRALFFAPVVMSSLAVSYIWQFIFSYTGPLNRFLDAVGLDSWQRAWTGDPTWALWTIFVVLVWQFAGLAMVMYLSGLAGIPEELDEAAAVDGASTLRRFRTITLPLLAPAFTVSVTLSLVYGLGVFDQVLALTGGGPVDASETLATQIYKQTFAFGRYGYGAALSLILTVLITAMALAQLAVLRYRERRI